MQKCENVHAGPKSLGVTIGAHLVLRCNLDNPPGASYRVGGLGGGLLLCIGAHRQRLLLVIALLSLCLCDCLCEGLLFALWHPPKSRHGHTWPEQQRRAGQS